MTAGYSPNPLFRKLGLAEGFHVRIIHAPDNYPKLISEIYKKLIIHEQPGKEMDFIHFFPKTISELEIVLPGLKKEIRRNGMIWISWYKISAGIQSELSEKLIRDTGLANGLVDVKVCAIDKKWSGLKFVFRLKDRK
jgi:hypothetical protein